MLKESQEQIIPTDDIFYHHFSSALSETDSSLPPVDRHNLAFVKTLATFIHTSEELNANVELEVPKDDEDSSPKATLVLRDVIQAYFGLCEPPELKDAVRWAEALTSEPLAIEYNFFKNDEEIPLNTFNTGSNPVEDEVLAKILEEDRPALIAKIVSDSSLSPREAEFITKRFLSNIVPKKIGEQNGGISRQTVNKIIDRALKKLAKHKIDLNKDDYFI